MTEKQNNDLIVIVSRNLKRYRLEKEITLYRLSKLSNVSVAIISAFEKKNKGITLSTLQKLCSALEIDDYKVLFEK